MLRRDGAMVCRSCNGELQRTQSSQANRRGGATFTGQRGTFERPRRGGGPVRAFGQALLGRSEPDPEPSRPRAEAVVRSATRWKADVKGSPDTQLGLFPFDTIREGQRAFARDVQRTVERGGFLVAHAPTGLGKTAAAIAPALKEALERDMLVLFLTSKQSQHHIVVDTLRAVVERRGGRFAAVDVISKRDMCPRPEKDEMPSFAFNDFCTRLCRTKRCNYFTEDAQAAIEESKAGIHHVEELVDISLSHGCCPHKVAMGAAKEADVVVCDYNYLFSDLRERILDAFDVGLEDLIVIVDEAHNLAERVRANFSLELSPYVLDEAAAEARRAKEGTTERWCRSLAAVLDQMAAGLGEKEELVLSRNELLEPVEERMRQGSLEGAVVEFDGFLKSLGNVADQLTKGGEPIVRTGQLGEFLDAWKRGGNAFGRILRRDPNGRWKLAHTLLDPSVVAGPIFADLHAAILMSGTLWPPEMYRDILGLPPERTRTRAYDSPFDPANRPVLCVKGVTTKYDARSDAMFARMGRMIAGVHRIARGNTAAFCPSYDLVSRIEDAVRSADRDLELIVETRGMSKSERDQILDQLRGYEKRDGVLLLGVLGGSLSEGVDYRDNLLRSVSVVGMPLAPPGRAVDLLIERYERKFPGRGWDYAYTFPAMERVLQAAGRGIRSETDRCAVVLLDERFNWQKYARTFPDSMRPRLVDDPVETLSAFFAQAG